MVTDAAKSFLEGISKIYDDLMEVIGRDQEIDVSGVIETIETVEQFLETFLETDIDGFESILPKCQEKMLALRDLLEGQKKEAGGSIQTLNRAKKAGDAYAKAQLHMEEIDT